MRVCTLLGALWALAACGGNTLENREHAAAGGGGRDAGRETGSGGTTGGISLDAALRDSSLLEDRFTTCAYGEILPVESEAGGAWCSVPLPSFAEQHRDLINVAFAKKDGGSGLLYHVRTAEGCDSDVTAFAQGWYYYDLAEAARIGFCPNTCASISIEGDGTVTVMKGCGELPPI